MMATWEQNIELINKRIKGQLSPVEEQLFKERLHLEPEFANDYQEIKLVNEVVRTNVLKRNFYHLQELEKSLPQVSVEKRWETDRWINWRKWSIAAGVLLIVTAGSYFFFNNNISPDVIFDENFVVWSAANFDRGEGDIDLRTRTYALYNAGKYEEAIPSFDKLISEENAPEDYLSLGMLYMTIDQMPKAIKTLELLKSAELQYQLPSKWYTALAHIKLGNKEEARLLLEDVKTNYSSSTYAKKASVVLKKLRKVQ